jgi:hypothetical protein
LKARALHDGLEAPAHRLDFRKLRHESSFRARKAPQASLTIMVNPRPDT